MLNGGSATSKALGSIAVFGGTLDGLAPIAGALLQKDVRHAASLAADGVGARGRGVRRGRRGADVDGPPAMSRSGSSGPAAWARPMVRRLVEAGHEVRALGRTDEKRRPSRELGAQPVTELADVGAGAEVVVVCVFTDDQVQQLCLDGVLLSDDARRAPRSSSTPQEAPAPRRRSPPRSPAAST